MRSYRRRAGSIGLSVESLEGKLLLSTTQGHAVKAQPGILNSALTLKAVTLTDDPASGKSTAVFVGQGKAWGHVTVQLVKSSDPAVGEAGITFVNAKGTVHFSYNLSDEISVNSSGKKFKRVYPGVVDGGTGAYANLAGKDILTVTGTSNSRQSQWTLHTTE